MKWQEILFCKFFYKDLKGKIREILKSTHLFRVDFYEGYDGENYHILHALAILKFTSLT